MIGASYVGKFEIEMCGLQRTLGLGLGGTSRLQSLTALIDDLFGNCAGLHEGQPAVEFTLGKLRLGPRVGELALRPAARPPQTGADR